jgi:CubicO group peptidase (beta-lactamase class C family)
MRSRHLAPALALCALVVAGCSQPDADPAAAPTTGLDRPADDTTTPPTTPPPTAPEVSTTIPPAPTTSTPRTYDFSAISPIVQQFVDDHGLDGAGLVIVDREDGIVDQQYWGEFSADRVSLIASSSKMITAGVLMALADQGLLDVDAPVADAVDWGAGNPTITPAQLVSNSSGLVGLLPDMEYPPYVCQMRPEGSLEDCARSIFTATDDDADIVAPDTEFRYGGGQWQAAGGVAEAVSGKSWDQLINDIYIVPCGVDSLGYNNQWTQFGYLAVGYPREFASDPNSMAPTRNPNMEGGAYINPVDYATLLLMHLRGGRCGDRQVISSAAIDRMHADRIGDIYGDLAGNKGYGLGWLVDHETGRISDAGAYGSVPWLDLQGGYGAYLIVESSIIDGNALVEQLYQPVADAMANAR